MEYKIDEIDNALGGLYLKHETGKHYWSISESGHFAWKEILEFLYKTLLKYERNRIKILNNKLRPE